MDYTKAHWSSLLRHDFRNTSLYSESQKRLHHLMAHWDNPFYLSLHASLFVILPRNVLRSCISLMHFRGTNISCHGIYSNTSPDTIDFEQFPSTYSINNKMAEKHVA